MKKKVLRNADWGILVCVALLVIIGLVALYSATVNSELEEFKKQLLWICISIPIFVSIIFIDYELIAKISPLFLGVSILLVIGVLFTEPINGATRWYNLGFFSFQPTEIAKIFFLIFLSYIIVKFQQREREDVNKIRNLLLIVIICAVPTILTAIQPNIGDAVLFIIITGLILFVAGIKARYIIISLLLIVILVPTLYFTIMPLHAKARIDVYLNPDSDPRGAGYNIIQSKLAMGAGRLLGMGWQEGTQTHLRLFIS